MAPFWSKEAKEVGPGAEKEVSPGTEKELSPGAPRDAERQGSLVEAVDAEYTSQGLQRKLQARHVQMIAIGSNIGTGLFIGSGKSLATGGPLGLVLGFILISIALPLMMHCLGEMSCLLPISGAFTRYASRFYDRSLGFAIGWQYWLAWVSVFGAEASAFVILINYWDSNANLTPLWISIFILINMVIHVSPVGVFGEVEFWVSALKVVAVCVFIVVCWAIMGGAGPQGQKHGAEFWHLPGLNNGLANDFKGLASVFVNAGFACGGVEMVGVAAGEAQQPRWNLPRAIKTLMWRIVIFYVFSMLFLSFVVPYTDDNLVGKSNAKSSPFVIAIFNAGIKGLPDLLNAVVMVCVCSVGSSSIYISSRTLHAMAEDGFAFSFFAKTDSRGRPYWSLLFTASIAIILAYLNCSSTGSTVFSWFSAISSLAFFLAWLTIIACNWKFHAALKAQNDTSLQKRFAYRAPFWPWLSILAFVLFLFMVICQLVIAAVPIDDSPSASNFFSSFLSVPIFLVMWAGYKIVFWKECKSKRPEEIDLVTGRRDEDPEEEAKLEWYAQLTWQKRAATFVRF